MIEHTKNHTISRCVFRFSDVPDHNTSFRERKMAITVGHDNEVACVGFVETRFWFCWGVISGIEIPYLSGR